MERRLKCPKCGSKHPLRIEKGARGKIFCVNCNYRGPYVEFLNHPDEPAVRSEIECIGDRKCWALVLRLATSVCYKDLQEDMYKYTHGDGSLAFNGIDRMLTQSGYSLYEVKNSSPYPWTVRDTVETFSDVSVVMATKSFIKKGPQLHFYQTNILFTTEKNDKIFDKYVRYIWIRK